MRVDKHQQRTRGTHPQCDKTLLALRVWIFARQGKVVFKHRRRVSKRHTMCLQICSSFYSVSLDFHKHTVCTNVYLSIIAQFIDPHDWSPVSIQQLHSHNPRN